MKKMDICKKKTFLFIFIHFFYYRRQQQYEERKVEIELNEKNINNENNDEIKTDYVHTRFSNNKNKEEKHNTTIGMVKNIVNEISFNKNNMVEEEYDGNINNLNNINNENIDNDNVDDINNNESNDVHNMPEKFSDDFGRQKINKNQSNKLIDNDKDF